MLIVIGIAVLASTIIIGRIAVREKRWRLLASHVALATGILLFFCVLLTSHRNPYRILGIPFLQNTPGASGRFGQMDTPAALNMPQKRSFQ